MIDFLNWASDNLFLAFVLLCFTGGFAKLMAQTFLATLRIILKR